MSLLSIPTPAPDFPALARHLRREHPPGRVFFAELYLDEPVKIEIAGRLGIDLADGEGPVAAARRDAPLMAALGYDLVRVHLPDSEFRMDVRSSAAPAAEEFARTSQGYIVHEQAGPIQNEADLESYPWPRIEALDLSPLEWAEKNLPDGMKAYDLSAQFFEACTWLLGYESLFTLMYEDPDFVEELLRRVGETYLAYTRLLCDFDCVGAVWAADDMGFRTGTLVPPDWLRENILPLHREAAAIAHGKGKLYFLHSCGKVNALMDDYIDVVGIDAKHSFEDAALPVVEASEKWGGRTAILGGIDVDFLSRATAEEVRARTRATLEACHPRGGYCLGSGNSITDYVPVENYLAMLDEGLRFSREFAG